MVSSLIGKKIEQFQTFLEDGTRIPVTGVLTGSNFVLQVKSLNKDKYRSVQLGCGKNTKIKKPLAGVVKKSGAKSAPLFIGEVRLSPSEEVVLGDTFTPVQIFEEGDIVDVTGNSKGKGFAGVVKRHHFKGGPRTHGQSDRERAPGSIGQTTTPGRVYKGKRMAGRMGNTRVTVKNLRIVGVSDDKILIKGLIPGFVNSMVVVKKVGKDKKFVPLYKKETEVKDGTKEVNIQDKTEVKKEAER